MEALEASATMIPQQSPSSPLGRGLFHFLILDLGHLSVLLSLGTHSTSITRSGIMYPSVEKCAVNC